MASKRRIRRRSCEGKQRHGTRRGALIHAVTLRRSGEPEVVPYYCPFCGGWHVGHPIGMKAQQAAGGRLGRRV